jgi:iron-sulfur cluster assembly protein
VSFSITDKAVEKAKSIRKSLQLPETYVLRVGLQGGGCSGFKYDIDFIEPPDDESTYKFIEKDGFRVLCDRKSYIFLVGTEIDYEETIMASGFKFNTPKATSTCGCGESVGF